MIIPSGVTAIEKSSFSLCNGLVNFTIPSSITSIGHDTFAYCRGLTNIVIPSSVTAIGYNAFAYCGRLKNLVIPSSVTSIGYNAFKECCRLTCLVIPSSVTSIGHDAFSECSGLASVYVSWETPLGGVSRLFAGIDKTKCILYVPQGTYQDYLLADVWGDFENIVEFDVTGIDNPTISSDVKEVFRYSINGQKLSSPAQGMNIVKYSDGSVKKVAVQ